MQNGMEMEWNWNGNGMEINCHPDMEVKLNGMEWKRKGNEMERLWRTMIFPYGFGNGMEWKWNWNGNSRLIMWNFQMENLYNLVNSIQFHSTSIPFHSMEFHFPFKNGDLWVGWGGRKVKSVLQFSSYFVSI